MEESLDIAVTKGGLEGGGVHSTHPIAPKTISMAKSSFIIHITNKIIRIAEPLRSLLPINRVRLKMYVVFNNRFRNIQTTSPPPSSANLLFLLGSEILSGINYRLAKPSYNVCTPMVKQ